MQLGRQGFHQLIFGHADGPGVITQGVFGNYLVLALAQQQADGGAILWMLELGIHRSEVKAQLAQVLGLELAGLELDHHVAAQLEVIEQQIDEELVAAHIQQHLPADEGEACTQFQQKFGDMPDQ